MVLSTRVGQALSNIDFVQTLCMSADKPTDVIFFHDFDAIFRNTTKPTRHQYLRAAVHRPSTER